MPSMVDLEGVGRGSTPVAVAAATAAAAAELRRYLGAAAAAADPFLLPQLLMM